MRPRILAPNVNINATYPGTTLANFVKRIATTILRVLLYARDILVFMVDACQLIFRLRRVIGSQNRWQSVVERYIQQTAAASLSI